MTDKTRKPTRPSRQGQEKPEPISDAFGEAISKAKSPTAEEHLWWHELPFIPSDLSSKECWPDITIKSSVDDGAYAAECAVGALYACELIGHMRQFSNEDGSCFADVLKSLVEKGRWGGLEIGFAHALGRFLVTGDISIGTHFAACYKDSKR